MAPRLFRIIRPLYLKSRGFFILDDRQNRAQLLDCSLLLNGADVMLTYKEGSHLRVWPCDVNKHGFYADVCGFMYSDDELRTFARSAHIIELFGDEVRRLPPPL